MRLRGLWSTDAGRSTIRTPSGRKPSGGMSSTNLELELARLVFADFEIRLVRRLPAGGAARPAGGAGRASGTGDFSARRPASRGGAGFLAGGLRRPLPQHHLGRPSRRSRTAQPSLHIRAVPPSRRYADSGLHVAVNSHRHRRRGAQNPGGGWPALAASWRQGCDTRCDSTRIPLLGLFVLEEPVGHQFEEETTRLIAQPGTAHLTHELDDRNINSCTVEQELSVLIDG